MGAKWCGVLCLVFPSWNPLNIYSLSSVLSESREVDKYQPTEIKVIYRYIMQLWCRFVVNCMVHIGGWWLVRKVSWSQFSDIGGRKDKGSLDWLGGEVRFTCSERCDGWQVTPRLCSQQLRVETGAASTTHWHTERGTERQRDKTSHNNTR